MGTGTNVALEAADVALMHGGTHGVVEFHSVVESNDTKDSSQPVLGLFLQRNWNPIGRLWDFEPHHRRSRDGAELCQRHLQQLVAAALETWKGGACVRVMRRCIGKLL